MAYFDGVIDNVMVFDKALTVEEIGLLYNGGSGTETIPGSEATDGTLYISYDANSNNLYLSHTGYGSGNAYIWQTTPNPLQGQWMSPVDVIIGGGSNRIVLNSGDAYLDNFEITTATLIDWRLVDFDTDGDVDLRDFAIFASAWRSSLGDGNWNPVCDISGPDNVIDVLDLAVFTNYWLGGIN